MYCRINGCQDEESDGDVLGVTTLRRRDRVDLLLSVREVVDIRLVDVVLHRPISVVVEHRTNGSIDRQLYQAVSGRVKHRRILT